MRKTRYVIGVSLLMTGLAGPAVARQDPLGAAPPGAPQDQFDAEPAQPDGAEVLTQGPIHEAFAQPVLYDPKPGPVVTKTPPAPIEELPPDQKPEGDNVQWLPGYWSWDDERNDFLWVSGVWRSIPPGRQWVSGYWNPVEGGSQWVPGYWGVAEGDPNAAVAADPNAAPAVTQVSYLPEPPASQEAGPTSPPPSETATWSPGIWAWQDDQYVWRPGFWVENQPGWVWNPAQYSWTPNGYLFNQGYWDYPLDNRGTAFAPVYFTQAAYSRPNFQYTPTVGLLTSGLLSSLFVRPAYHQYNFGDYYAQNNYDRGIYPAYSFHQSRYGYDPLYAQSVVQNRANPRWAQDLHDSYDYRREHAEARPPRTFNELRRVAARPAAGGDRPAFASDMNLARPLAQIASAPAGAGNGPRVKYQRVEQAKRQDYARQAAQVRQHREERQRREVQAFKAAPPAERARPRRVEMPRSPVRAASARVEAPHAAPPAQPPHPQPDRNVRPFGPGQGPNRHEPRPGFRPPNPAAGPHPGGGPREGGPRPDRPGNRPNPGAAPAPAPGPGPGQRPGAGPRPGGRPEAGPGPGGGRGGDGKPGAGPRPGGGGGGGRPEAGPRGDGGGGRPKGGPGNGGGGGGRQRGPKKD